MNSNKPSIWHFLGAGGGDTPTDIKNNKSLTAWSLIWAAAIIGASAIVTNLELDPTLHWSIALVPNVAAFFTLRCYLKFLRMTDEMQRRVQIEGLAIGFGTGYAFTIGYLVAEAAGAPPMNMAALVLVMTIGWLGGNLFAVRRYQ